MSERNPTSERGRIRITGFDVDAVEDYPEEDPWATDEGSDPAGRRARIWRRFKRNRTAQVGLVIIAVMAVVAVFARPISLFGFEVQPIGLTPHPPNEQNFLVAQEAPSLTHPFGTDWAGRDILSRVMVGGRFSLSIGVITVGLAVTVGVPFGAIAGYYGGWVDEVVMRVVDVMYAFPFLVLAIVLIAAFGQGFWKMIFALVLVGWITYARIIRGEVLKVKENDYVTAARALGAGDRRIIFKHIVPNAMAPVIVSATLNIGTVVLAAAGLGFLGLGLTPGTPEWGSMLSSARESLIQGRWWSTVFPGLAIFLFVLSINLVGDGVRDALNPQGSTREREVR